MVTPEVRELIRKMSRSNPLWGAPRIHGELLKIGVDLSKATVNAGALLQLSDRNRRTTPEPTPRFLPLSQIRGR
jgi:hypothetical protein